MIVNFLYHNLKDILKSIKNIINETELNKNVNDKDRLLFLEKKVYKLEKFVLFLVILLITSILIIDYNFNSLDKFVRYELNQTLDNYMFLKVK